MTNEHIKEKYGIEPIMKEMWVWDDDNEMAITGIVAYKMHHRYPYLTLFENGSWAAYRNASEINPNEKEIKVGDKGYFWDSKDSGYVYTVFSKMNENNVHFPYMTDGYGAFINFSHEKQPWME